MLTFTLYCISHSPVYEHCSLHKINMNNGTARVSFPMTISYDSINEYKRVNSLPKSSHYSLVHVISKITSIVKRVHVLKQETVEHIKTPEKKSQ